MARAARSTRAAKRILRANGSKALAALLAVVLAIGVVPEIGSEPAAADAPGFSDNVMFTGLDGPTAFRFSSDGRVFVSEKSGLVKVFDGLSDSTAEVFVDLRTQVHNYWDRGLLGLELAPNFPTDPHVYVLYAHDAEIGGTAPRWGTPGESSDPCPTPPGPNADGCVISGRLSRFVANGNTAGVEQVLIEDWCAQYPSHTIGDLRFGPDGALYVSGGDGASFNFTDWGQVAGNPCNDYPYGPVIDPPETRGGGLRSQHVITDGEPVSLDGAVLRVDPATGDGLPGNPFFSSSDPNARRIIAEGMRNPFRFTIRPGTEELYLGDVGANTWEEINVVSDINDGVAENFGWPCMEGNAPQGGYEALGTEICENLYAAGTAKGPLFNYLHGSSVVPGDGCPHGGGDSITGVSFNDDSNNYPPEYDGTLFFTDLQHQCIWAMFADANGNPDPTNVAHFMNANNPAFLTAGPEGDLWYADIGGGSLHRISFGSTSTTECPATQYVAEYFNNRSLTGAPLLGRCETVIDNDWGAASPAPGVNTDQFSVRWSSTRTFAAGTYDFTATADDGVRVYIDDDAVIDEWADGPARTFTASRSLTAGLHDIRIEYYDNGLAAVAKFSYTLTGGSGNLPPTPTITSPTTATTWKVGDTINFTGSATDPEDGALPASALSWRVAMLHCPVVDQCHEHVIQSFPGVAGGTIVAPDHDWPSKLQFQLTATDSSGAPVTTTTVIDPQTATLRFESVPSGLRISHGAVQQVTPFERTVIIGSANSISAPTPQTLAGTVYNWESWSDGSGRSHNITAAAGTTTLTATYDTDGGGDPGDPGDCATGEFLAEYFNNQTLTGAPVVSRCEATINNDWGVGSPAPGVNIDGFSVRWTGSPVLEAGEHVFSTTADDGVRVFVDGLPVIDQWKDQGPTTYTANRLLAAGVHPVRMEFYENGGGALARLSWTNLGDPGDPGDPGDCPVGQFTAEYFNNQNLSGTPVLSRCEATITNEWGGGSPGPGVNADGFSVRWIGSHNFTAGNYDFTAIADDGLRVFVDGALLIDQWHDQGPTTYTASRMMTTGAHPVRMDFYENGGGAMARLSWLRTGGGGANLPPTATISAPTAATTWQVGDTITFAGSATDPEDGALPATSLTWQVSVLDCATTCHEHAVGTFADVAGGSFVAPDHAYPSTLQIELTATDSLGEEDVTTVLLAQQAPSGGGECTAAQFTAEYFNNVLLSGTPVLTRCEAAVDNGWAGGSPAPGINADGFSARWTTTRAFAAGDYDFTTITDDGVRLYVDGALVIDQWHDQGPTVYTGSRTLAAGNHTVRMDYYENVGGADARLSWVRTGGGTTTTPPVATISAPATTVKWEPGDTISFAGSATDAEDGTLGAGALTWRASVTVCDPTCHEDAIATFTGVAGGSFAAPATGSSIKVELTAVDSGGLVHTISRVIQPIGDCPIGQYRAEYFNNATFAGTPALSRCETTIDNDWGTASPGPGVNIDGYTVRWTATQVHTAGSHLFTATADDGVRVFVDGTAVIDEWHDGGATTYTALRSLPAGVHRLRIDYYEAGGDAVAKFSWSNLGEPGGPGGPTCPAGQFAARYFNNILLGGAAALARCEAAIDHDWGGGSPGAGVSADGFSAEWIANPTFTAGAHTFTVTADDGVRVYIDDVLVIDQWKDQAPSTYAATRTLTAGAHEVRVEYYERGGGAVARLVWT